MAIALPMFGGEDRLTVRANGAALAAGQLVTIDSFTNNELKATVAAAPGEADGVMNVDVADGELGACIMLVPGTVIKVPGAGIAAGALVEPTAAGAVATADVYGDAIGRALTATDADGNVLVLIK